VAETPPVVIEIIDAPDRIAKTVPILDEMLAEGMVTLEDVHIIAYRAARK
jgi:PII-like signaling protein